MHQLYIYQNCDTCRKALKWLAQRQIEVEIIPIREQPPTQAELKTMLAAHQGNINKLFNTSGKDYRALKLAEKLPQMTREQAIKLLSSNGNLVKRPFLLGPKVALVGFKPNEWQAAFADSLSAE